MACFLVVVPRPWFLFNPVMQLCWFVEIFLVLALVCFVLIVSSSACWKSLLRKHRQKRRIYTRFLEIRTREMLLYVAAFLYVAVSKIYIYAAVLFTKHLKV